MGGSQAAVPYVEAHGVKAFIGERRRYGGATFTWVRFVDASGKEHNRDPWPSIWPNKADVEEQCRGISAGDA